MSEFESLLDAAAREFLKDPSQADESNPRKRVEQKYPIFGVGGGMAREVFTPIGVKTPWEVDIVVKFPLTPDHISANRLEVECWDSVTETPAEKYFTPILAAADDNRWIVQQKVDEVGGIGDGEVLEDKLSTEQIPCGDMADENVGWIDEELVVLDFQWGPLTISASH